MRVLLAAGVLAGGVLAGGCTAGGSADSITLYNGQHPQTTGALVAAFEKDTGITVRVRNGDESVLANQVVAEGGGSPADVIFTENSPALAYLGGKDLLAPVDPSTLEQVPRPFSSPRGDWVGVSARVSVVIYNRSLVRPDQVPTSVLELAEPRWRGKLALAPAETDFQPVVTSVLAAKGPAATLAWLTGLKANAAGHLYPDNETITSMVNSGQAAVGIINQYYWYRLRSQLGPSGMHSSIAFFAPHSPGYVVDVSGAAALRSSPHQREAQRFLAFLVSPTGQQIIAHSDSFEYPLAAGVAAPVGQPPLDQLQPYPISVARLGDGAAAVALLQKVQLL